MQILILINVWYLQNVVFSFEEGSHHLTKKSPQPNLPWLGGIPLTLYCSLENHASVSPTLWQIDGNANNDQIYI